MRLGARLPGRLARRPASQQTPLLPRIRPQFRDSRRLLPAPASPAARDPCHAWLSSATKPPRVCLPSWPAPLQLRAHRDGVGPRRRPVPALHAAVGAGPAARRALGVHQGECCWLCGVLFRLMALCAPGWAGWWVVAAAALPLPPSALASFSPANLPACPIKYRWWPRCCARCASCMTQMWCTATSSPKTCFSPPTVGAPVDGFLLLLLCCRLGVRLPSPGCQALQTANSLQLCTAAHAHSPFHPCP